MSFNYIAMNKNYRKTNYKQIQNWLLKMEQLISNMRSYINGLNANSGEQLLSEKKIISIPVDDRIIDKIIRSPTAKTPQQKVAMAKQFQAAKLQKAQTRNAVKSAATTTDDEALALSFINQNTTGRPYKIVPDAATGNKN
jgi:hypothetical protein